MSEIGQMGIQLSKLVENIVGQGKIACNEQSPFPKLFSKAVCW